MKYLNENTLWKLVTEKLIPENVMNSKNLFIL